MIIGRLIFDDEHGRGSEREGACAHGHHTDSVRCCLTQRLADLGGRIVERCVAGHHHRVRGPKGIQSVEGLDGKPGGSRHQAGPGCADPEGVPFPFVLVAENLRRNGKVKGDHIRQCEGDDSVHRATVVSKAPGGQDPCHTGHFCRALPLPGNDRLGA